MTEILYLSYDGMTDPLGQSQVIPYLAGLSKLGYHFHLISFEKSENFRKEHNHILELMRSHQIEWHPLTYTKKPPVISTMRDLSRMKKRSAEIIAKHDIQLVHCRSYISGLAGIALKEKFGIQFLFDMRGFWADERVEGGLWNLTNPMYKAVYKFFKNKEKEMFSKADAVVSLTENAKNIIDSWNFRKPEQLPISIIPCCADLDHFNPGAVNQVDVEKMRHKLKIPVNIPVISYLGAIGTWYMLDEMLDFFRIFIQKYPQAIFLFISHEPFHNITEKATRRGIPMENLRHLGARRTEVPVALSLSDTALFFIRPTFSKKASSPTKQGEIMGMGIPLICNTGIGDTDHVVERYGAGLTVDLTNKDAMQMAVDGYSALAAIPKITIIKGAEDFFSLSSGVQKYAAIYSKLLN
ncbi:MAG: glycosyltransferase [Bacteroidetes bacterium]|nr:glycosyltransferase [Bacteroidota bacterium]